MEKKKRGLFFRLFRVALIALAALIVITGSINLYMVASTKGRILTVEEAALLNSDCALVLGAGLRWDGTPSDILADRLKIGVAAYDAGAAERMLMSGDHGKTDYDEVNAMKRYATDRNVPSSHIFMDHAGFSTYESMYRADAIFQVEKMIVVTQEYHLYRALYNARAMGIEAYGISSSLQPYARQAYFDLREYFARVKDFFMAIFKPAPTYLGDVIPITGDGNLTND